MAASPRFNSIASSIEAGLANLKKWYQRVDKTDAYFISLSKPSVGHKGVVDILYSPVLDPSYKLAYVQAKWDRRSVEKGRQMLDDAVSTLSVSSYPGFDD